MSVENEHKSDVDSGDDTRRKDLYEQKCQVVRKTNKKELK